MAAAFYIAATPALLTAGAMWRGYVLTILWAWFAVPTLGLAPLTLAPAIGLSLVVGFLTHQIPPTTEKKPFSQTLATYAFQATVRPASALLVGWIVTHWMPV